MQHNAAAASVMLLKNGVLFVIGKYTSATTFFVNECQDNIDLLIPKQCYNFKLRIEGSHNRVIKSIFDSCSFKASKLFAKWRYNIEVTRI